MFRIELSSASRKQLAKLDEGLREQYLALFKSMERNPFIEKLAKDTYHKHITYHWVAVWHVDKKAKLVTVTYIGSREGAPY